MSAMFYSALQLRAGGLPEEHDLLARVTQHPTRADGSGGLEFMLPIPVYTPRAEVLRGPTRPFWEVDVEVTPQRMPAGRNLRSEAMLPPDERDHPIVLRSGRDGISFKPMNMLFVPGGATLEQSVVRPRLRVPGLRGWIEELAAQIHPDMGIELSQAGRRAMILARLWGSRADMAKDLRRRAGRCRHTGR